MSGTKDQPIGHAARQSSQDRPAVAQDPIDTGVPEQRDVDRAPELDASGETAAKRAN